MINEQCGFSLTLFSDNELYLNAMHLSKMEITYSTVEYK